MPLLPGLRRRAAVGALLLLLGATVAACSGSTTTPTTQTPTASSTVWLCRPGAVPDPCAVPLIVTRVEADGTTSVVTPHVPADPPADCFYVYPTVSTESGDNADLRIQPAETNAAEQQAAPFSQVCRVWAPMYRQATLGPLLSAGVGTATRLRALQTAYDSLSSAFEDYLAHDNHGRPIVFIGHSQGTVMLIRLLRQHFDAEPSMRSRMVSAVLAGGNVEVPTGKDVGGTFASLPACTSPAQTGCVIAYSTFDQPPPADSLFGRPGTGVSIETDQTRTADLQVLCTNPAALSGGPGPADAFAYLGASGNGTYPTPFVEFPADYQAQCMSQGGATWLNVSRTGPDVRPQVRATLGAAWGLHLYDINLFTGNLVQDVGAEIAAYRP
ncbi:MAG TPA: DUF3089 domain-containing protein [Acidimicrobiales bacterium]|nr:DUF3089 domain-containing protein [Acidimicrobiales bacterium]